MRAALSSFTHANLQRLRRLQPWAPWFSLVTGLLSGALMDRSPRHAWVVLGAALAVWLAYFAFAAAVRTAAAAEPQPFARAAGRLAMRLANQTAAQQLLLFALPFYARAACAIPGHLVFLGILGVAATCSLWDPLHEAILHQPVAAAALHAVATFAGLNVVLPVLGLSHAAGLTLAALATCCALLASARLGGGERRRTAAWAAYSASLVLAGILTIPQVRGAIPAAPLRLVEARIGTGVFDLAVVGAQERFSEAPPQLACLTQIWAPRGLRDSLQHVWSQDGHERDRVGLTIVGGQEEGFRTWSIKRHLGHPAEGTWRCEVRTRLGQTLGGPSVRIGQGP